MQRLPLAAASLKGDTPMRIHRKPFPVSALVAAILAVGIPSAAVCESTALAEFQLNGSNANFDPLIEYSSVRISIVGPDGFEVTGTFSAAEAAAVPIPATDGLYKYELRFAPLLSRAEQAALAAARESGDTVATEVGGDDMVQSGSFRIENGALLPDLDETPGRGTVVTNADGIIRNSLCVGFDCPNSPSFSDTTILMMENNTRIKFDDTSSLEGFPRNDWEIEANSNLSNGASYLGINDCGNSAQGGCATDLVFAVEAGARQSALYVESDGDIGIGTSNPVTEIHAVRGDTPTLRLDQDGSSGFAPQVWDVAGNETSFFIRDVTGGSTLPFRINPGAPSSSIHINASGDVGMGTASPGSSLQVRRTAAGVNTALSLVAGPSAFEWQIIQNAATGRLTFFAPGGGAATGAFKFDRQAQENLLRVGVDAADEVEITGRLVVNNTQLNVPDFVFQDGYKLESIEDHAAFMWENSHLPALPRAGEDNRAVDIDVLSHQMGMLEELEKAHIYIEQLNGRLKHKDSQMSDMQRQIAELTTRLEKVEQ